MFGITYVKGTSKRIKSYYFVCLDEKTDLCKFYKRFGCVDLKIKIKVADFVKSDIVNKDATWTYFKKDLSNIKF